MSDVKEKDDIPFDEALSLAMRYWARTGRILLNGFTEDERKRMEQWDDARWREMAKLVAPSHMKALRKGYVKHGSPRRAYEASLSTAE